MYQAAVADIDTDEMWTFYLNAVHAINVDTNHTLLPLRRRMLGQAYKAADTQGRMDRFHYSNYVQLMYECNASDELVEPIVKRAIAKFGDSIEIWTIYMKHYMHSDNADRVKEVFEQSRKRFAQTGAPLWKLYVEYVSSVTPSKVKDVYNEVLVKSNPEFDEIKMKYIDWAYSIGGIKSVLDVYNQADTMGTVTLGMVNKVNDLFLLDVSSVILYIYSRFITMMLFFFCVCSHFPTQATGAICSKDPSSSSAQCIRKYGFC